MHSVSLKFLVGILSFSDYYPFGMQMVGRNGGEDYRYAFNGMEKDDEVKGSGNNYDMGERLYDPRLGRAPTTDPAAGLFPGDSPFMFAGNNPIYYVDKKGKWKARFKDNNDHSAGIVFAAEKGDNLLTLALQLGIPYQELVDQNFGGNDFTLDAPLSGGQ
jgi:RHS repeat-associated protein